MSEKRLDRRVGRTKRALKGALLELIQERPYSSITVQEITDRADIGRSTFYSHFDSKEELLFDGFDHWLMSFSALPPLDPATRPTRAPLDPRARPSASASPLLRHIRSERRFFETTMVNAFDGPIHRKVTALLVDLMMLDLVGVSAGTEAGVEGATGGEEELALEARAQCLAGAFLALAGWWLRHGQSMSAEAVAGVFAEVAGLQSGAV